MNIKTVYVKKLYTYGNYQNIEFGYSAELEEGESIAGLTTRLSKVCDESFDGFAEREKEYREFRASIQELENQRSSVAREVTDLKSQLEKLKDFFEKMGIEPEIDIPF